MTDQICGLSTEEFDRRCDLYSQIQSELDLEAVWSIYETMDSRQDFDIIIHPNGATLTYEPYGGRQFEVRLCGPVTTLDMWKAADKLMKLSGDLHHVFVEAFTCEPNGTISLSAGS